MYQDYLKKKFSKEIKGFLDSEKEFEIIEKSNSKICFLKHKPLQTPLAYIVVDPFETPIEKDYLKNANIPLSELSGLLAYKLLFDIFLEAQAKIDFSKMYLILELIEMTGLDIMPYISDKINFYSFYFSRNKHSFCLWCGRKLQKFSNISFCSSQHKRDLCRKNKPRNKLHKIFINNVEYLRKQNIAINDILKGHDISLIPIKGDYLIFEKDQQLHEIYLDLINSLGDLKYFIIDRLNKSDEYVENEVLDFRGEYSFVNQVSYGDEKEAQKDDSSIWLFYKEYLEERKILHHYRSSLDPAHNHFQYDLFEFYNVFQEAVDRDRGKSSKKEINIVNFMTMKKAIEKNLIDSFSHKKQFINDRITRITNKPLLRRLETDS